MSLSFSVITVPKTDCLLRKLHQRHPDLEKALNRAITTLSEDPYNRTHKRQIRKLENIHAILDVRSDVPPTPPPLPCTGLRSVEVPCFIHRALKRKTGHIPRAFNEDCEVLNLVSPPNQKDRLRGLLF